MIDKPMPRKLMAGALGAASMAAEAVKHMAWYFSHQVSARPRKRDSA